MPILDMAIRCQAKFKPLLRAGIFGHTWGDLSLPPISEMWGRYRLHLSDLSKVFPSYWLNHLTNRKEAPPFSPAGPHIRSGLLDPTSFQKFRFRCNTIGQHWLPTMEKSFIYKNSVISLEIIRAKMITLVYVGFVCFVMGKCRSSLLTAKFRT
jgi:hypothetical protein